MKWKNRTAAAMGNALEFYDIAVFSALSIYISDLFASQDIKNSVLVVWGIFALRFLLRPLGGYVIAQFAERRGRKAALILASLLTGIATLLMSFVPVDAVGQYVVLVFLFFQLIQAFSFGGEYPTLISYLLYDSEPGEHSRISSLIVGSSITGVLFALGLVFILENSLTEQAMRDWGWRVPLFAGVLNILFCFWYRLKLPDQQKPVISESVNFWNTATKIFMVAIVGAVTFYVQNMASGILGRALDIENFAMINSAMLLLSLVLVSFATDKLSTPTISFKVGVLGIIVCAIPLYWVLDTKVIEYILIAQVLYTIMAAMVLGNLAAVLFHSSKNQLVPLGVGYNVALSIFGGLTPLIITGLIPHGFAFVGLYIAAAGVPALIALRKDGSCRGSKTALMYT